MPLLQFTGTMIEKASNAIGTKILSLHKKPKINKKRKRKRKRKEKKKKKKKLNQSERTKK